MTQIRPLYNQFAEYYDLLHSQKNYTGEVKEIKKLIKRNKKSDGRELLDVACGTGRHLAYFKNKFACTGIDFHDSMLKVARKNVEGVIFKQAEMENFRLKKQFDVITCLYGGISYTLSIQKLKNTLENFVSHLKTGGVVIIEPYFTEKQFKPNKPTMSTIENKDIKIARLSLSKRKRKLATRKMIMTVVEKDKGIFSFEDERDIALFSVEQILKQMKNAGLKSIRIKNGISSEFDLYVGIKK